MKSMLTMDDQARVGPVVSGPGRRAARTILRWLGTVTAEAARGYEAIALQPSVAAVLVVVIALLLAAAASAAHGFRPPGIHDEFSYLLGADTFASGRLTNPTHPMWRYFETFHVLQRPTYTSKYPPANALFLAAGWVLTGRPIVGVWVTFAFMCVALHWMLVAWIGRRWALGLTLAVTSWLSATYWSYSYWGGAIAAGAGALALGALYRIVERRGGTGTAILLGVGLLLLANSRPYEGALLAVPITFALVRWAWRDRQSTWRRRWTHILLPLMSVGAVGMLCMGIYNQAVTGNWHEMPYLAYEKQVSVAPIFLWQGSRAAAVLPEGAVANVPRLSHDSSSPPEGMRPGRLRYVASLADDFLIFIIPIGLTLPLLLIPLAMKKRWTRFALSASAWMAFGMGVSTFFQTHYAAPMVALLLGLYGDCLRWLARFRLGARPAGRTFAAAIVALWFLMGLAATAQACLRQLRPSTRERITAGWRWQRQLISDTLTRRGPRNLVIVRYSGQRAPNNEWVYNAANIDGSAVVWARDRGDSANKPLLDYFRDRTVWSVHVDGDEGPYRVSRYVPQAP